jgi:hypothetical protein
MDRRFQKAVVSAFRDEDAERIRGSFAPFDERDWLRGSRWLHTSGLALYLLRRTRELGVEHVIPTPIRHGLELNLEQNRKRTQYLFSEFKRINIALQRAKISYANLKGFALAPRSCGDPVYRYQHDLDFMIASEDAEPCRRALEALGYRLTRTADNGMDFSGGEPEVCSLADLYKTRSQSSVEVHFTGHRDDSEVLGAADPLSRLQLQVWDGFEFPALSDTDILLDQATHLFKHFQSEWTRTAWMLEYATAIRSHACDGRFWQEAIAAINHVPAKKTAVGAATLLTMRAFGIEPPADFVAHTVDALPSAVRSWFECYGDDVIYVEIPGTKLYLLLQDVLLSNHPDWQRLRRRRLLPLHVPARHGAPPTDADPRLTAQLAWARIRFVAQRVRFHIVAGLRYKREASRWKLRSATETQQ